MIMKLRPFDHFLLVFLMVILVAVSLLFMGAAVGITNGIMANFLNEGLNSWVNRLVLGVVSLIVILVAVRVVVATGSTRGAAPQKAVMVKVSDQGQIMLTLSALDTMVQKAVRGVSGVRDMQSQIFVNESQAVVIQIKLALSPDALVPEICENVQKVVRDYVQTHAGLPVVEIPVSVEQIGQGQGPAVARVE